MLRAPLHNARWQRSEQLWLSFMLAVFLHLALFGVNGLWTNSSFESDYQPALSALSTEAEGVADDAVAGLVNRGASGNAELGESLAEGAPVNVSAVSDNSPLRNSSSETVFSIADAAGREQLLQRHSPLKVYYSKSNQSLVGFAEQTQFLGGGSRAGSGGDASRTAVQGEQRLLTLGAASREDTAVQYVEGWRRWMRANGNLFYPAEARRLGLRGEVLTQVRLNSDGSLADVRILRSSGQRLLDEAVLKTTREARWYLPFPEELAQQYSQLEFSWRWRYGAAAPAQ